MDSALARSPSSFRAPKLSSAAIGRQPGEGAEKQVSLSLLISTKRKAHWNASTAATVAVSPTRTMAQVARLRADRTGGSIHSPDDTATLFACLADRSMARREPEHRDRPWEHASAHAAG